MGVHETASSIFELLEYLAGTDDGQYLYRGQTSVFGDSTRQVPRAYRRCTSWEDAVQALRRSHLEAAWLFSHVRPPIQQENVRLDLLSLLLGDTTKGKRPGVVLASCSRRFYLGIRDRVQSRIRCADGSG